MEKKNSTLGYLVKIANLMVQRKYLENIILEKSMSPAQNGNPTFRYAGYIFPENIKWLKENKFDIFEDRVDDSNSINYGIKNYVITPEEPIHINEEDLKKANSFAETFYSVTNDIPQECIECDSDRFDCKICKIAKKI